MVTYVSMIFPFNFIFISFQSLLRVDLLILVHNLVDGPGGHDLSSYYSRDDERGTLRGIRDTDTIGASYDRYLRSAVPSSDMFLNFSSYDFSSELYTKG